MGYETNIQMQEKSLYIQESSQHSTIPDIS